MTFKRVSWGFQVLALTLVLCAVGAWAGILPDHVLGVPLALSHSMLVAIPLVGLPDMFTVTSLTDSITKMPYTPTKIGDSSLFTETGIATRSITIDEQQGRLVLVPNLSVNDDPVPQTRNARKRRTISVTHIPVQETIRPEELQNLVPFGQDTIETQQARVINDRLASMKANLDVTREWQRLGAICGQILDADSSVILDLFAEYGITKRTQNVALSVGATDVRAAIMQAKRAGEAALGGVIVKGWRCYCEPSFFDSFVGHANVQKAFANYQEAQDRIGGDLRTGFTFGGVEFVEYNATVSGQQFIPTGKAKLFPIAPGIFRMYNAPANYNETVNTLGLPYYAKAEPRELGKGWKMEAQSNPLALCTYPETLTEFVAT